jgi:glutamine amidotransferase-like uncharacterized protein
MPVILATPEDHSLKPAQAKQFRKPYLKKTLSPKRAGVVAQGVRSEFKPQYCKKKKKEKKKAVSKLTCQFLQKYLLGFC